MKKRISDAKFTIGLSIVGFLFLIMLSSFFYLPYNPNEVSIKEKFLFFSARHILGTDGLGRDVFCRVLISLRVSFFIGFSAATFGFLTGTLLGSFGGFFGGKTDAVITKIIDVQMAFPGILMALMLVSILGPSMATTLLALCIMSVPRFARISRGGFIKFRNSPLVLAQKARGASVMRIMFLHVLPNIRGELMVTYTLTFAISIMNESGLSYLGLGVQPPAASFGKMLSDAQSSIFQASWVILIPAFFLALLVIGFTLLSDGFISVHEGKS